MELTTILLILVIIAVAIFDFTNGFHDSADIMATAVASRAMTPAVALSIVAFFTFLGPLLSGLAVADTVGTFVQINEAPVIEAQILILSAILAAITYNLVTWRLGLPSSSSNSLAGGLVGATLYVMGSTHIHWGISELSEGHISGMMKIVVGLFFSPFAGFIIGFILFWMLQKLLRRLSIRGGRFFIYSQYLTVSWLGFSHGANDAQKGMAIIAMMLFASGATQTFTVPEWSVFLCTSAISIGAAFGGWRIIKTLGYEIIKVKTLHSFSDQVGAALVNTLATSIGAPTSTTQVVTGTLLGIGAAEKPKHVKWRVARNIILGWLINIPISMLIAILYCILFLKIWG